MLTSMVHVAELQLLLQEKNPKMFSFSQFGLDRQGWSVIQTGDTGADSH